jgi:hypothetical protein
MSGSWGSNPGEIAPGEVGALTWRKSRRSLANGQCVEAARLADGRLAMRNSRNTSGLMLLFTEGEWRAFIDGVKDGDFDGL